MLNQNAIFNIKSTQNFNKLALQIFKFQFNNNSIYRSYCDLLHVHESDVTKPQEIPFLPIQFFKTHRILSTTTPVEKIFTSSGTTGTTKSTHYITHLKNYETSFTKAFTAFYGKVTNYTLLALLPNYLEQEHSSLIYMVNHLIQQTNKPESGFYLDNYNALKTTLETLHAKGEKVLLIGVSFALLNFVEQFTLQLPNTIIMETGGMKGKRKELIREALHEKLKKGFGVAHIHSEYGMTELLSQAYSKENGVFACPPWMRVYTREVEDALSMQNNQKTGGLNIIDLANYNSCSFIATQDLGKVYQNGTFEVLGRFDTSDIRGCNLMVL